MKTDEKELDGVAKDGRMVRPDRDNEHPSKSNPELTLFLLDRTVSRLELCRIGGRPRKTVGRFRD